MRRFGWLLFVLVLIPSVAAAEGEKKNLQVLANTGKDFDEAMKKLSKGLAGDKACDRCHDHGNHETDNNPMKSAARRFFKNAVGEKDQAKREAALKTFLKALDIAGPKDAKLFWEGVDKLKRK